MHFYETLQFFDISVLENELQNCFCCDLPTEAMLCIKEVEMVESVDELKTSQSNWRASIHEF